MHRNTYFSLFPFGAQALCPQSMLQSPKSWSQIFSIKMETTRMLHLQCLQFPSIFASISYGKDTENWAILLHEHKEYTHKYRVAERGQGQAVNLRRIWNKSWAEPSSLCHSYPWLCGTVTLLWVLHSMVSVHGALFLLRRRNMKTLLLLWLLE